MKNIIIALTAILSLAFVKVNACEIKNPNNMFSEIELRNNSAMEIFNNTEHEAYISCDQSFVPREEFAHFISLKKNQCTIIGKSEKEIYIIKCK